VTGSRERDDQYRVRLAIRDTGIGIPEDRRNRLFEVFSQVDASTTRVYGGTGLGLAICKRLTEAMHGDIAVDSTVGVGSTFTVTLPMEAASPELVPAPSQYSTTGQPLSTHLRILLAEDNVVNQRLAQLLLERLSQSADVVSNGVEAVNAASHLPYDLILMDVLMPEMDGLDATRQIRARLPKERQPRIIAMTANALSGDRERCLAAGMDDYISKPVQLEELAKVLQRQQVHVDAQPAPPASAGLATEFRQETIDRLVATAGVTGATIVLGAMIESAPRLLDALQSALEQRDAPAFRRSAHSLKANAATVGADALAQAFQELEDLGNAGNLDAATERTQSARQAYQNLVEAVTQLRKQLGA
jgi:CheY-like chemotaxis protein